MTRTAPRPARDHRRHTRHQRANRVARHGQLEPLGLLSGQRPADVIDDARMTDGFDVQMIDGLLFQLEDPARGVVHQLNAALVVDHQHALDHAGENRLHPRAIAKQAVHAPPELLHRLVHAARDGAEVVVAVIG